MLTEKRVKTMRKAYYATGKWKDCATVVFAENRGKAKTTAMSTEACEDVDFVNIQVHRLPHMDKYYKPGKTEMDWYNPEDRIALVKDAGFRCEYVELEKCKQCPAREYCSEYKDYKQE